MDHYLLIDSTQDLEYFPGNTPVNFANRISPPLLLQPGKQYQMALLEIFSNFTYSETPKLHLVNCDLVTSQSVGSGSKQLLRPVLLPDKHLSPSPLIYVPIIPNLILQRIAISMSPLRSGETLPEWYSPPAKIQMLLHIRSY